MDPLSFERMSRDELVAKARALGVERPELMTRVELGDEIVRRTQLDPATQRGARGWLGVARDMVASVVESGLNLPDAAALIRGDRSDLDARGPAPVATVTLAEIYATQGHLERALTMLEEVLAKEPDHPAALALQTRLAATPRRTGNRAVVSQTVSAESSASAVDDAAAVSEPAPLTTLSEPTFDREPEEVEAAGPLSEGPSESQVEVEVRVSDAPPALSEPPPEPSDSDVAARFDETESSTAIRVRESGGEEAAFTPEPSPAPLEASAAEAPVSFAPPPRTDTMPVPSDSSPFNEFVAAHPGTLPIHAPASPPEQVTIDPWRGSAAEFPPEQMAHEPSFEALAAPITETMEALAVQPPEDSEAVASSAESADAVTAPRIVMSELLEAAKEPAESIVLVLRTRGVHPSVCWAIPESLLRDSGGNLELECVGFVPAKEGAERRELSLSVDAPRGRLTLPVFDAKTVLRVALGNRDGDVFVPRVIASEFSVENDIIGVRYRPPFSMASAPSASEVATVTEFLR